MKNYVVRNRTERYVKNVIEINNAQEWSLLSTGIQMQIRQQEQYMKILKENLVKLKEGKPSEWENEEQIRYQYEQLELRLELLKSISQQLDISGEVPVKSIELVIDKGF